MFAFVALGLVSSVIRQEIGSEEKNMSETTYYVWSGT